MPGTNCPWHQLPPLAPIAPGTNCPYGDGPVPPFTPTSASWLNLVERFFAALTEKQIKRGAHRSVRELESAIKQYLAVTNESPKPFIWTKSADEILASVARFCARTSGSGH